MQKTLLYKEVWQFAKTHKMFDQNSSILIALSGGPDSVALVSLFIEIQKNLFPSLKLSLAHLNHLLRGDESYRDEAFVYNFAEKVNLPLTTKQLPVEEIARGANIEATARHLRYEFLQETATKIGATSIATAHNLNDQAETFLMRLIRGAGIRGLSAIKPVLKLKTLTNSSTSQLPIIRPLLNTNRNKIENYIVEKNLPVCIDSSNFSTKFTRNKVRLEIIPKLLELNPKALEAIARTTVLLTEWEESLAESLLPTTSTNESNIKLSISSLKSLAPVLRHQKLRNTIEQIQGKLHRLTATHIFSIDNLLLEGKSGKKIVLPGQLEVLREFDDIIIRPKTSSTFTKNKETTTEFFLGQTYEGSIFSITYQEITIEEQTKYSQRFYVLLDIDKVGETLKIRNRKPGDSYQPLGHQKQEKLKNLMIEKRIVISQRDDWPIITTLKDKIVWVPKLAIAAEFAANSKTRRFAIIIAK